MSNMKIVSATLEDNYAFLSLQMKMADGSNKRIYYRFIRDTIIIKIDGYLEEKDIRKTLDVLRGLITDKRNYQKVEEVVVEKIGKYMDSVMSTTDMSDKRYYFDCQNSGINFLNVIAKKMGMSEDVTRELRENLERDKAEAGVTE